jgi:hypothetical protein
MEETWIRTKSSLRQTGAVCALCFRMLHGLSSLYTLTLAITAHSNGECLKVLVSKSGVVQRYVTGQNFNISV